MAGRLAAVLEEDTEGFTAFDLPLTSYRDWIRTVAVSGARIQSGHNASSFSSNSGASSSYLSSISGCSSGSASACVMDLTTCELSMLACQMVSDGYTQRMVQEFDIASSADRALENWLFELDVDWVLQIRKEHVLCQQLQDKSSSSQHDLVERWIRALIVIGYSMRELGDVVNKTPAMARFAKASISAILVFVDAMAHVYNVENLHDMLHMLIWINATYWDVPMSPVVSPEAQHILQEISDSLDRERDRLWMAISSTIEEVKTPMEDDDSWAVGILRGGGGVHRNTRLMMDCIMSMRKASALMPSSARGHFPVILPDLIDDTVRYLKDLLQRKSLLCSDPSLTYMFLLNNSYFIAQMSQPPGLLNPELWSGIHRRGLKIRALYPECEKYMDSYLDVSWGHVLSCISQSKTPGLLHRWVNTSSRNSLAEFKSAFHKTYQAQKFWKVPDPQLRDALRKTIAEKIIPGYRNYLKEHPELEKYISDEASSPEVLEEMLGELFEG